ncbi:hypothetical protein J7E81_11495 [Bacillus sp. ISL-18]|uniref:hypothetical protein n=1 Tax=Bacillus sp. ISL-18 TaxID=2819118 RepID=UPI001BE6292E|nr:hypothetical protein [Bacillus sp. ISL-18]MBT2655851.1 hypothetical protein [Bacillus sp. ISL-18]
MKIEKLIADELQCMFLEEKLIDINERYINLITKQLRTGEIKLMELTRDDFDLKEKVLEALLRILNKNFKRHIYDSLS